MSQESYYSDESQWGSYQYITLEEIINNYMMSLDNDDYTSTVPRFRVRYQARRALRELYYDVLREIKGIRLTLSENLIVTLPPDYVNYVRISWVDDNGFLHPMAADETGIDIAREYLQDNDGAILFDEDGCPLEANESTQPLQSSETDSDGNTYYQVCPTFQPNRNLSKTFPNGRYRIDKDRGVIEFGSDAFSKDIVLEYISDGLYTGCENSSDSSVRVHKFAESAMLDFIYYQLIKNRRNVRDAEKFRARKEYYNSRRVAKRRINTLRRSEMIQAMRGSSKWIKDEIN